jgi:hypothetical protein
MVLYAYMCVFVHSCFNENPPIWSWETNPLFLRWFCPSWYQSKIGVKHIRKHLKIHNNVFGEESLAHIRTIVVSLGGKLTYVLFYATTKLHRLMYVVIFGVFILFCCWWPYFVVCGLCRTIKACECLLLLFMDISGCLCLDVRTFSGYLGTSHLWTWVGTSVLVLYGHEWRMMIDLIPLLQVH